MRISLLAAEFHCYTAWFSCVGFSLQYQAKRLAVWRAYPIRPILCRVGCDSVNHTCARVQDVHVFQFVQVIFMC